MTANVKLRLRRLNDDYKCQMKFGFVESEPGIWTFEGKSC